MNCKPPVEAYNSMLFDRANLKAIALLIKHRHELFDVSQNLAKIWQKSGKNLI